MSLPPFHSNCQWSMGRIDCATSAFGVCPSISIVSAVRTMDGQRSWPPNTSVAGQRETPKAHRELKGDKGRWGSSTGGGYSCLIACPTCRLDVSRCPIYSCSPSSVLSSSFSFRLCLFSLFYSCVCLSSSFFPCSLLLIAS